MLKWTDTGIILKVIKQGEKGNLVNVLTNNHGRHMGWFNNYSKKQYLIQPGDIVNVSWSSRISNQLGFFKIELIQTSVGKIFDDEIRLNIISSFCSLISIILPEREICSNLFCKSKILLNEILNNVSIHETLKLYIYWELSIIKELGFEVNFLNKHMNTSNRTVQINGKEIKVPSLLINNKSRKNTDAEITEALNFNKTMLLENIISPNRLKFPLSRNILEKYYN